MHTDTTTPDTLADTDEGHDAPDDMALDTDTDTDTDTAPYPGMSATYSPDDNKLRLYSSARLDPDTYKRVKAAGFSWAPKQELFVASMWTPSREDLLLKLCGEIGDEDTSLVQRAEQRADRFDDRSARRARESDAVYKGAKAIASNIPFGQPILVGHHSEGRHRRDLGRIEAGYRKAAETWQSATYWKERAAGALAHAAHHESPDVRARRIKRIEADKRKRERQVAEAEALLKAWSAEDLTLEQAKDIAGRSYTSRCFPLADYPRDPPASQYEGQMSLWSALDGGVINVQQAREICLRNYPATIAYCRRWIEHYDNRLVYERAMLQEQGGLVAEKFALEVGGEVLVRGDWKQIVRVNKKAGRIVGVTTNCRFVPLRAIEEIKDYRAPTPEAAAAAQAAAKLPPLANYPGEGFMHLTQAQWNEIPSDYKKTKTIAGSGTVGRHRARIASAAFGPKEGDDTRRHGYPFVYITDAKTTQPPTVAADAAA